MMQIAALPFAELNEQHFDAWSRIQDSDCTFDSPFFSPEFTAVVASLRDDVFVGIMKQAGRIVGLLPFQRGSWGRAEPVGGEVSQFNGVLVEPGVEWDVDQLLRGCELRSWTFDYVSTRQTPLQRHFRCVGDSPFLDLTNGFPAYCAEIGKSSKAIEQAFRKARKLEREVGPLRFELHDASDDTFHRLLAWKSEQHHRTNVVDAFQRTSLVALLDRVRQTQTASFAGLLSSLYAGDQLVAAHLGLRSETVAHSWYPAYDMAFAKHSPGITLLLKMAEALAAVGIQRIDLAAGEHTYKSRFMSGAIPVARGVADVSRLRSYIRHNANALRDRMRETPLARSLRASLRMLRRVTTPGAGRLAS
ncbi:MAG: GNAT family N-acetyltransferase [Planctomycetota bacterium]